MSATRTARMVALKAILLGDRRMLRGSMFLTDAGSAAELLRNGGAGLVHDADLPLLRNALARPNGTTLDDITRQLANHGRR